MKIVLGLPIAETPSRVFLDGLARLRLPPNVASLERVIVHGNFVPGQRELIARKAAEMRADVLVMMDDDMVLPPHTLVSLLDALHADERNAIAGVLYYSRDGAQPMAVTHWARESVAAATVPSFHDAAPTRVDGVGFGCVAIRMSALAELDLPLFHTQVIIDATENRVRICNEDYLLCERFRRAGMHVVLDARVRAGHYDRASDKTYPETWEDNAETAIERMLVRDAAGTVKLVPFDGYVPCIAEEHHAGLLDYVIR